MKPLSIVEIVKHVQAIDYTSSDRFATVSSVAFDSRQVTENSLFIPLKGQTDGHDYIAQAIANGATVTLWSRAQSEAPEDIAVIFVDDTLEAMQRLAAYYLTVIHPKVIAVTGSNGKTTTKDMIGAVLSSSFRTYQTVGNYNNEIGLPKTILDMPEDTEMLVLEMGMDDFGQIRFLSTLAQPDIAVVTLIGDSHLAQLGDRAGIARAKCEILDGLVPNGLFIFPENEPLIHAELAKRDRAITTQTFGTQAPATLFTTNVHTAMSQTQFITNVTGNTTWHLPVIGQYNAQNALAAILVGRACGVTVEAMQDALASFQLTANRTEWRQTPAGTRVLNDAYNASATSMAAILSDFRHLPLVGNGRRIAVLGDIREAGINSASIHASLAEWLSPEYIATVYLYGTEMHHLYRALSTTYDDAHLFYEEADRERLITALQADLTADDLVLVKSSFGTNLLAVVAAICE